MGGMSPPMPPAVRARRHASIIVGTVDMSGTNTAFAQIAAESFGLDAGLIRVVNADTEAAPYAGSSGGSKITYTVGAAVEKAARDARQQLFAIAARYLEAAVEDLELVDRAIQVRGAPAKAVPIATLAKASMQFGGKYEPVYGRGSTATIARAPAFAAHLAEVEVDMETGHVRVLDHVVVQDVGRALNPAAIEGQIQGAAAQGLGWALLERMPYDAHGQLLSATFMDYAMPAFGDGRGVRAGSSRCRPSTAPGAKGVGEPPVVAAPAAIANAVMDATDAASPSRPSRPRPCAARSRRERDETRHLADEPAPRRRPT
jgi:CO/xanthine dehydrogenase Mo-binding subunit